MDEAGKVTFKDDRDGTVDGPDHLSMSQGSKGRKSLKSLNDSVRSGDLFTAGKDDIIMEGELMKFKPGISQNFIPRYVQIS